MFYVVVGLLISHTLVSAISRERLEGQTPKQGQKSTCP